MELFFDLIFVALVGQLAHGLHTDPTFSDLIVFIALFATVWWAWVNLTFVVNVSPELTRRGLTLVMLIAMFIVGAIAVSASEATADRAWLFATGNAALRGLLLLLWAQQVWTAGAATRIRVLTYNGLTAIMWLTSIWLPAPGQYLIWGTAMTLEIVMLFTTINAWGTNAVARINVEHLSERFGLLVMIVLGESILTTVAALNNSWNPSSSLIAVAALLVVSSLAWSFFLYGADAMQVGLTALQASGSTRAIRDTVAFLPFLLVTGITIISGAIAVAVHAPHDPLPASSALSLSGGIVLFYLTNAAISLRFGTARQRILRWAIPSIALPLLLIPLALATTALATAIGAAAISICITIFTESTTRNPRSHP